MFSQQNAGEATFFPLGLNRQQLTQRFIEENRNQGNNSSSDCIDKICRNSDAQQSTSTNGINACTQCALPVQLIQHCIVMNECGHLFHEHCFRQLQAMHCYECQLCKARIQMALIVNQVSIIEVTPAASLQTPAFISSPPQIVTGTAIPFSSPVTQTATVSAAPATIQQNGVGQQLKRRIDLEEKVKAFVGSELSKVSAMRSMIDQKDKQIISLKQRLQFLESVEQQYLNEKQQQAIIAQNLNNRTGSDFNVAFDNTNNLEYFTQDHMLQSAQFPELPFQQHSPNQGSRSELPEHMIATRIDREISPVTMRVVSSNNQKGVKQFDITGDQQEANKIQYFSFFRCGGEEKSSEFPNNKGENEQLGQLQQQQQQESVKFSFGSNKLVESINEESSLNLFMKNKKNFISEEEIPSEQLEPVNKGISIEAIQISPSPKSITTTQAAKKQNVSPNLNTVKAPKNATITTGTIQQLSFNTSDNVKSTTSTTIKRKNYAEVNSENRSPDAMKRLSVSPAKQRITVSKHVKVRWPLSDKTASLQMSSTTPQTSTPTKISAGITKKPRSFTNKPE